MRSRTDSGLISRSLEGSIEAIRGIDAAQLQQIADLIVECYRKHGKVMLCGNGGSASQAQHIAAELVCRFRKARVALSALALTTDTSILTAQANDVGFETVFERQVEAHGRKGDLLVALSTSGNSPSIIRALETARRRSIGTIAFTGGNRFCGAAKIADEVLFVDADDTPRIQEAHIVAGHIICEIVENRLTQTKS